MCGIPLRNIEIKNNTWIFSLYVKSSVDLSAYSQDSSWDVSDMVSESCCKWVSFDVVLQAMELLRYAPLFYF